MSISPFIQGHAVGNYVLTWDDIDVEKCTVSINKSINEHLDIEVPKTTNAYRVNVIPKDVMAKLLPFKDSKYNKVFHTCTGEYIKRLTLHGHLGIY